MSMTLTNKHIGDAIKQRRFKLLRITTRFLPNLLKEGSFTVENALPADAIECGSFLDNVTDCICIRIASMEYAPVADGEMTPSIDTPGLFFTKKQ